MKEMERAAGHEACGCGHDHHHEHVHEEHEHHHHEHEACGCGHEHHHEHGHGEHEHHHHEHEAAASRETLPMPEGVEKRVYILENLLCQLCRQDGAHDRGTSRGKDGYHYICHKAAGSSGRPPGGIASGIQKDMRIHRGGCYGNAQGQRTSKKAGKDQHCPG